MESRKEARGGDTTCTGHWLPATAVVGLTGWRTGTFRRRRLRSREGWEGQGTRHSWPDVSGLAPSAWTIRYHLSMLPPDLTRMCVCVCVCLPCMGVGGGSRLTHRAFFLFSRKCHTIFSRSFYLSIHVVCCLLR